MIRGYACLLSAGSASEEHRARLLSAGCVQIYMEDQPYAVDGKKTRPALRLLLREVQAGDLVVVYRLDCLARSVDRLIRLILQLHDAGVSLRSLSEPWVDTTGEHAAIITACFSWLHGFSENVRQERYAQLRKDKEEQGKTFGRPKAFSEAERDEVLGWLADGMTMSKAARLKQVDVHTIYRLRNAAERQGIKVPRRDEKYRVG